MLKRASWVALGLGLAAFGAADPFYLALGDSIAFGYQPGDFSVSNGDRGYVGAIRDALGNPAYANYAVSGETTSSFADTSDGSRALNSFYAGSTKSQLQMAEDAFSVMKADGSANDTVSFALGANDLFALLDSGLPTQTQINTALAGINARYTSFLTEVRTQLPDAKLILPGYYNPFGADPNPFIKSSTDSIIGSLNAVIQGQATAFGGTYVDFFDVIKGHEAEYTHVGDAVSDVHPNDLGYAALGRAAAQAVPEPGSFVALGLGALVVLRKKRAMANDR